MAPLSDLRLAFETKEFPDDVEEYLESQLRIHSLSAEDLYFQWLAYSTNNKLANIPAFKDMTGFATFLSQGSKVFTKNTLKTLLKVPHTPKKTKSFEMMSSPRFGASAFSPGVTQKPSKEIASFIFNEHVPDLPTGGRCSVNLVILFN